MVIYVSVSVYVHMQMCVDVHECVYMWRQMFDVYFE